MPARQDRRDCRPRAHQLALANTKVAATPPTTTFQCWLWPSVRCNFGKKYSVGLPTVMAAIHTTMMNPKVRTMQRTARKSSFIAPISSLGRTVVDSATGRESTGFSISRDQLSMSVRFSIAGARRARHRAPSDVRRHGPARAPIRLNTSGHQPRSTQNLSVPAACTRSKRPQSGIRQLPAQGPS